MTERYRAENERSTWMRFHTQTAGVSLTAQQPLNNLTRVAIQALAAVLGGTQSLHTDAYDEALGRAVRRGGAPRAAPAADHRRGDRVSRTPSTRSAGRGSSRRSPNETERAVWRYLDEIDRRGGMVAAIAEGYPQREIADAAYRFQREFDAGERAIVGVNRYADAEEELAIPLLDRVREASLEAQLARLERTRRERDGDGRRGGPRRPARRRPPARARPRRTSCRTSSAARTPTRRSASSAASCATSSGSTASRSRSESRRMALRWSGDVPRRARVPRGGARGVAPYEALAGAH